MRLSQTPTSLISLLIVALSQTPMIEATPFAKEALRHLGFSWLEDRGQCASYCGAQSQYCCVSGEACYTNAANVAYCSSAQGSEATGGYGAGGYEVYTTTYTEIETFTSTYSSYYQISTTYAAATTTAAASAICTTSLGESNCGTICCAENQRCAFANSCTAYSSTYIATATSSYSAPVKGTSSGGVSTATSVVSATTTQTFLPAATASGSAFPIVSSSTSGGLSGGAIAGIVIGVIAGIILLLLICFCCIVKAGFDGLLALFGLGSRKRRSSTERVEVEERYSRHGSAAAGSRRDVHSGWFGGASRPARVTEKRKESSGGLGGLGMVGAGLLGLAAILGLKRQSDNKKVRTERSDISSAYYTDSYTGTSASKSKISNMKKNQLADNHPGSASSDRRTRRTEDTRRSRR